MLRMTRVLPALAILLIAALASACTAAPTPGLASPAPIATTAAAAPAAATATAQGLTVASVDDVRIEDTARSKTLEVRVTYPKGGSGPFPIIVFSHGASGSNDGYLPLSEHWASGGYVVLQPTHADANVRDAAQAHQAWSTRPGDVSALLDHLDDIEAKVPEIHVHGRQLNIGARAAELNCGGVAVQDDCEEILDVAVCDVLTAKRALGG